MHEETRVDLRRTGLEWEGRRELPTHWVQVPGRGGPGVLRRLLPRARRRRRARGASVRLRARRLHDGGQRAKGNNRRRGAMRRWERRLGPVRVPISQDYNANRQVRTLVLVTRSPGDEPPEAPLDRELRARMELCLVGPFLLTFTVQEALSWIVRVHSLAVRREDLCPRRSSPDRSRAVFCFSV